jgi:hypothetical protein
MQEAANLLNLGYGSNLSCFSCIKEKSALAYETIWRGRICARSEMGKKSSKLNIVASLFIAVCALFFFALRAERREKAAALQGMQQQAVKESLAITSKHQDESGKLQSATGDIPKTRNINQGETKPPTSISLSKEEKAVRGIPEDLPDDLVNALVNPPPELPDDFKAQLKAPPPPLPEDLKRQLNSPPPELPDDLKAQLNAPPPEIPEDIRRALATPPRVVTLDEVNKPAQNQ